MLTPKGCDCKALPPNKDYHHPFRRCLDPPHKSLLPCSSAEMHPLSAP
jgi:hypothetical protein